MKNSKRISYLGLLKFLAAIAIIFYHAKIAITAHGGALYTLVEFFMFITGYFTFKHFHSKKDEIKRNSIEKKATNAIKYSVSKIITLMPFVIITVILVLLIYIWNARYQDPRTILLIFRTVPADLLLMHSQSPDAANALWYISALAIALPVFCLFCQTKKPKATFLLLSPLIIVYFWSPYWGNKINGAYAIIRMLAGLITGASLYYSARFIKRRYANKKSATVLQIVETLLTIIGVILMYPVAEATYTSYTDRYIVIIMYIVLTIIFSQRTYTSRIRNKTLDYLEQISMPLFLLHIPVLPTIALLITPYERPLLYVTSCITISVLFSIITSYIVKQIREERTRRRKP